MQLLAPPENVALGNEVSSQRFYRDTACDRTGSHTPLQVSLCAHLFRANAPVGILLSRRWYILRLPQDYLLLPLREELLLVVVEWKRGAK